MKLALFAALLLASCTVEETTSHYSKYYAPKDGVNVLQVNCDGDCCEFIIQLGDDLTDIGRERGSFMPKGKYTWVKFSWKQDKNDKIKECSTQYGG